MNRTKVLKIFTFGVFVVSLWEVFIGFSTFGLRGAPISFHNKSQFVGETHINLQGKSSRNGEVTEAIMRGLNEHSWEKPCTVDLEHLCHYPIFPNAPDDRNIVPNVNVMSSDEMVAGIRFLGYLRPDVTDYYQFMVATNGFAELWLSTDKTWTNSRKIAFVNTKYSKSEIRVSIEALQSQISSRVSLIAGESYYIEVLYMQDTNPSQEHLIQVAWKRPHESHFDVIGNEVFVPYKNDSDKAAMKAYDYDIPDVLACVNSRRKTVLMEQTLPFLGHDKVKDALEYCEYNASYVLTPSANFSSFKRYHGVHKHTLKTGSFPFVEVEGVLKKRRLAKAFAAEYPMDGREAISVVSKYFQALKRVYPRKYQLKYIKQVERKQDPLRGYRYFLELVLEDVISNSTYILAEYMFQHLGRNIPLCYPRGFQWNRTADVYLIITAKNLGRWVQHFIKNVENIIQETKDDHLHVVVYDFDSRDINLTEVFERSTIKNYHFLIKPGNYSRTISLTEAIESIQDPNGIAVTMDLHLDITSPFINDVRKHCIKGRTVYAPQIVYLNCTGTSTAPVGLWYHYSYGTVAMYKQDWTNFGGFSADFIQKVTWGGEDWDLIDSAVKSGLEVERKRCPWIFHYYHSKKGMWQKPQTTSTPLPAPQTRPTKKTSLSSSEKYFAGENEVFPARDPPHLASSKKKKT